MVVSPLIPTAPDRFVQLSQDFQLNNTHAPLSLIPRAYRMLGDISELPEGVQREIRAHITDIDRAWAVHSGRNMLALGISPNCKTTYVHDGVNHDEPLRGRNCAESSAIGDAQRAGLSIPFRHFVIVDGAETTDNASQSPIPACMCGSCRTRALNSGLFTDDSQLVLVDRSLTRIGVVPFSAVVPLVNPERPNGNTIKQHIELSNRVIAPHAFREVPLSSLPTEYRALVERARSQTIRARAAKQPFSEGSALLVDASIHGTIDPFEAFTVACKDQSPNWGSFATTHEANRRGFIALEAIALDQTLPNGALVSSPSPDARGKIFDAAHVSHRITGKDLTVILTTNRKDRVVLTTASALHPLGSGAYHSSSNHPTEARVRRIFRSADTGDFSVPQNVRYADLPPHVHYLAIADDGVYGRSSIDGAHSFANVYRKTQGQGGVNVAFFGGSKLVPGDDPNLNMLCQVYDPIIEKVAEVFARREWSIVSGGGPGLAMSGSLKALRVEREKIGSSSKCIVVPSALGDEQVNEFADPEFTVRQQKNTMVREMLLMALAGNGSIFFAGNSGTFGELEMRTFENYVANRGGELDTPASPIILLDVQLPGKDSYFQPYFDLHNAPYEVGLNKGHQGSADSYLHRIIIDPENFDPVDIANRIEKILVESMRPKAHNIT